ncbi:MAG: ABC transporter permease [Actinomycetota bacterium]
MNERPRQMPRVLVIAGLNVRRILRDRISLFFILVLPVLIILLIGVSVFGQERIAVGMIAQDRGTLGVQLEKALEASPALKITKYMDRSSLKASLRRGIEIAGVIVPDGYDAALRAGQRVEVPVIFDQTSTLPIAAQAAISSILAERASVVQAAAFATQQGGGTLEQNIARAQSLAASGNVVTVRTVTVGGARTLPKAGFGYTAPSNLVLFVFINALAGAGILIETRRRGLARRMYSTPTAARTILVGQTLSMLTLALVQALIILVVGGLVFGVSWGSPLGAGVLVFVWALIGTGAGTLFGTFLRTPEQAGAIGPPIGIAFGMLGGCMWPLEIVGSGMRTVGHLFPHAWAMDAFIKLIAQNAGLLQIGRELAVLAAFAAVLLAVSIWRLRRVLTA